MERGHETRESVRDGSRESHVTEARAGESRERAPGARREGQPLEVRIDPGEQRVTEETRCL